MKRDCMIGFFTDPFPDELLYSACARYHRKARNISKATTSLYLFGDERIKMVVDFPTRLGHLAAQLPPNTYSVDILIDDHTLLPVFLPFTGAQQVKKLRGFMKGQGGLGIHGKIGLLTSGIRLKNLRFCVGCAEEDRRSCGQPYWHRLHQVPGVEVCPTHSLTVCESDVPMRSFSSYQGLITAKEAIANLPPDKKTPRTLNPSNHEDRILLQLALGVASLLNTRFQPNQDLIRRRYANLLFECGLASFSGVVKQGLLTTQFLKYYSPDFLARLGCELKGRQTWLRRVMQGGKSARHPLHHLLLITFLGSTPEKFFQLPSEMRPFGYGPWPCLNQAVAHFREPRIAKCQVTKQQHALTIMGTFKCDCGFSYRRNGFDESENRRFEYDRIITLGDDWYTKLQQLISAGHLGNEIASILGVTQNVVQLEIGRLRKAKRSNSPPIPRFARIPKNLFKTRDYLRAQHRDDWTKALATHNPTAGRTQMRAKLKAAYSWLTVNDREWLNEHLPPLGPTGRRPKRDWSTKDHAYTLEVRRIATEIRNAPGPPVRIAQSAIARTLHIHGRVFKSQNLPLTKAALVEVSDTNATFAVRRIRWATNCFLREPSTPQMWRIWWKGHVSRPMRSNELVKAAWQRCLQELESHYNVL
jgi:Tn7-like transposition protein D/TniQ